MIVIYYNVLVTLLHSNGAWEATTKHSGDKTPAPMMIARQDLTNWIKARLLYIFFISFNNILVDQLSDQHQLEQFILQICTSYGEQPTSINHLQCNLQLFWMSLSQYSKYNIWKYKKTRVFPKHYVVVKIEQNGCSPELLTESTKHSCIQCYCACIQYTPPVWSWFYQRS